MEIVDPQREKLLIDVVDPMWSQSRTERELPIRVHPYMDMAEPKRAKDRTDPIEASPTKSRIDIDEAILATP
jgi:hypothetical protein